jgi:hypothetical protein
MDENFAQGWPTEAPIPEPQWESEEDILGVAPELLQLPENMSEQEREIMEENIREDVRKALEKAWFAASLKN